MSNSTIEDSLDLDGVAPDSHRWRILPGLELVVWRWDGGVSVFYDLEEVGSEVDAKGASRHCDETRLALTFGVA
jgi:hypothetical protein